MTLADEIAKRPAAFRRTLAILITAALVSAAWSLLVGPVMRITRSQEEWRAEIRAELARAKGRAAARAELQSRVSALPDAPIWARFYEASDGGDARAAIQRDVTAICATAGTVVQSIVPLPATEESGLTRHALRITATATADQMKTLMGAIRSHARYLRVEHLTVAAPQVQSADQNPPLVLSMELSGYSSSAALRGKT